MTVQQNVDASEIAKFEAMADRWWDLNGEFKPLHEINPLRLDFINLYSQGIFSKNVLDVGCGGGILAESMAKLGAHVTGIDMGEEPLNVAKLHALEVGVSLNYEKVTAEAFAEQNPQQFDVVTCMEMLEHVPDPESVIASLATLVKPGGHVFMSTLNKTLKGYLFAIVGAEHLLKIVPKGTHDHDKFIKPATLINWAEKYGLKARIMKGLSYNPLGQTYSLTNDVSVNYMIHFEKLA
ncbi:MULTISPECIES: bifunctional 2-polyprenyl-6-hydroxyphenol methylase/3-demethylubiquinol 3-O-methyltransferase UbiG [Pseudoalteromonas]|uniref:bifunctional 2-polyprenyl-6-hydroxyphenol methylase/3-demethylubiquinol 3-O-methyltransferase UbiG n=1 Tax=Pseudoalteromonas TaxID=53246 RepID=UPI00026C90BB|nr:bifunctional 2-polyprenyl-6-hydroxyphenol methylase/3-demethylubiquinol 3-O-methyltransferase UbiG [Pseudoalteromonas spongiae]ATC98712.1 2-polyprenyl-6-hydroxyphenyl methylase / 3-demethylubiquinone-9 3-methyltransferase [Pseudoalteromonas spongiae UST010723-006]